MRRLTTLWYLSASTASAADCEAPSWIDRCALALLQPLAWAYAGAVRARRAAYARGWLRAHAAGRPVVVVGNLTVGGTGKTPLIVWLAGALEARGFRVGIVSRGYGRATSGPRRVHAGSRWEEVGDEPLLVHRRTGCAVLVAEDRAAAARRLAAEGADVVLSDDGLQHLRLARDCEIVVVDGARGFGNGRLLPAGPLREPISAALRADFVVVNDVREGEPRIALHGRAASAIAMHLVGGDAHRIDGGAPARSLESFRGAPVHAVAGIGHPARFFRALTGCGLRIIEHPFPDHHPFAPGDLDFADDLPILMTEKDAVRCAPLAAPRLWYVPVETQIDPAGAAALLEHLGRLIRAAAPRRETSSASAAAVQAGVSSGRVD